MKDKFWRLGLVGYPLGHSLSPRLHSAALDSLNLKGEYRLYPVPPGQDGQPVLVDLLDRMRRGEVQGLNVTIPHKQAVLPFLDGLTPAAQAIGAVNIIVWHGNRLLGDNTDAPGFLADLERFFSTCHFKPGALQAVSLQASPPAQPPHALLLGAGGAARAVAFALLSSAWQVTIAARRPEQADQLVGSLQPSAISDQPLFLGHPITAICLSPSGLLEHFSSTDSQSETDLIVNATPLGMYPHIDASPWPAEVPLPQGAALYDLIYNPAETVLVREARAAGLPATTGLGMLIEQAALAFESWTGLSVPRKPLWAAVPEFSPLPARERSRG